MPRKTFAEKVTQAFASEMIALRKKRDLSMNQLAVRAGCARSHITNLEAGTKYPTLEMLCRIGFALGISPSSIMKRLEKNAGPVPRFKKDPYRGQKPKKQQS